MALPTDLNFEQARGVYSALLTGSQYRSQAEVFGELSLAERSVVVRAIEVLEKNEKDLLQNPSDHQLHLSAEDKQLRSLINRLKGTNPLLIITNEKLAYELKGSHPLAVQGRAEIVLANAFLFRDKFLQAIEPARGGKPAGELYQQLEAIVNSSEKEVQDKKKAVLDVLSTWVDKLDPGEGKNAAQAALKNVIAMSRSLTFESGFNRGNLQELTRDFRIEVHTAVVKAWNKEPLTKHDLQAMGVGSVGLTSFLSKKTVDQKKSELEELSQSVNQSVLEARDKLRSSVNLDNGQNAAKVIADQLVRFEKFEASILPFARYPEFAALYSRVLGEHANLMLLNFAPCQEMLADWGVEEVVDPEMVIERAVELKKIKLLYAMSAAAGGNGEAALDVARDTINYGDWSLEQLANTRGTASFFANLAMDAAKKTGDNTLIRKARLLQADILAKDYLSIVEIRRSSAVPVLDGRGQPINLEHNRDRAVKAYTALGSDGIQGLYQLAINAGVSADPLVDLLRAKLINKIPMFRPRPTAEEIKMLTTLSLAGNEKAIALLKKLGDDYPVNLKSESKNIPELKTGLTLLSRGVYTEPQKSQAFSLQDAMDAYQSAGSHIACQIQELEKDGKLTPTLLSDGRKRFEVLQKKYSTFLNEHQLVDPGYLRQMRNFLKRSDFMVQREEVQKPATAVSIPKAATDPNVPELAPLDTLPDAKLPRSRLQEMWQYFTTLLPSFRFSFSRASSQGVKEEPAEMTGAEFNKIGREANRSGLLEEEMVEFIRPEGVGASVQPGYEYTLFNQLFESLYPLVDTANTQDQTMRFKPRFQQAMESILRHPDMEETQDINPAETLITLYQLLQKENLSINDLKPFSAFEAHMLLQNRALIVSLMKDFFDTRNRSLAQAEAIGEPMMGDDDLPQAPNLLDVLEEEIQFNEELLQDVPTSREVIAFEDWWTPLTPEIKDAVRAFVNITTVANDEVNFPVRSDFRSILEHHDDTFFAILEDLSKLDPEERAKAIKAIANQIANLPNDDIERSLENMVMHRVAIRNALEVD